MAVVSVPRAGGWSLAGLWDGREWPCAGWYCGRPVFRFGWAPSGLATTRQLAALGLRPGGQEVAGWLAWGRLDRARWAYLYRLDLAARKRPATPAQLAALARAETALRTCPSCGENAGYRIPRVQGECWHCAALADTDTTTAAGQAA